MALWTFSTIIPFEIRDAHKDSKSMKTIPHVFGVRGSKMIGTLMLFGVVVLSYCMSLHRYDMITTLIDCGLALVCLWKSTIQKALIMHRFGWRHFPWSGC